MSRHEQGLKNPLVALSLLSLSLLLLRAAARYAAGRDLT